MKKAFTHPPYRKLCVQSRPRLDAHRGRVLTVLLVASEEEG